MAGGQGVAGSNPAVPTGFSNTRTLELGTKIAHMGTITARRGRRVPHPRSSGALTLGRPAQLLDAIRRGLSHGLAEPLPP